MLDVHTPPLAAGERVVASGWCVPLSNPAAPPGAVRNKLLLALGVSAFVPVGAGIGRLVSGPKGLAWGVLVCSLIGLALILFVPERWRARPPQGLDPRYLVLTQTRLLMLEGDPGMNVPRPETLKALPLAQVHVRPKRRAGEVSLLNVSLPGEQFLLAVPRQFRPLADALAALGNPSGTIAKSGRA